MPVKCKFEIIVLLRFLPNKTIFTAAIVQQIIKYIKFCISSNTKKNLNLYISVKMTPSLESECLQQ